MLPMKGVWLVVSTHFKNISQIGSCPQVGVNIKNIPNHHLGVDLSKDLRSFSESWNSKFIHSYFLRNGSNLAFSSEVWGS